MQKLLTPQQWAEIHQKQYMLVEWQDNDAVLKTSPRFCIKGFKNLQDGQAKPDAIYFDGNKNYDAMRKSKYHVKSVVEALNIQLALWKNLGAAELRVYDNQQTDRNKQLIYQYIKGIGEVLVNPWRDYINYRKI